MGLKKIYLTKLFKYRVWQYLHTLNKLQNIVFDTYIQQDYYSKRIEYEKIIHHLRRQLLTKLQLLSRPWPYYLKNQALIILQLTKLYEIIFALNSLKLSITDHSVFAIAAVELRALQQKFTATLSKKTAQTTMLELNVAVQDFILLHENTLQVMAAEPIIFLFISHTLLFFDDEINILYANFL
jgi:hypothetical protein